MNNLSILYSNGTGCVKDSNLGEALMYKAAKLGGRTSMRNLGSRNNSWQASEQEKMLAFEWFRKAAMAGHCESMCWVASLYLTGRGTARSIDKAHEWMDYAASACSGCSESDLFGLFCGLFYPNDDSTIEFIGFVEEHNLLAVVTTKSPGEMLVYHDIPKSLYWGLLEASAGGSFYAYYWNNIATKYKSTSYDISGFCDTISGR